MDNSNPNQPGSEIKPNADPKVEPKPDVESQPVSLPGDSQPLESRLDGYMNDKIRLGFNRVKSWSGDRKAHYLRSPRLRKFVYQGKFMPAFWTVTAIFSLVVNVVLIAILVSFGRFFFQYKALVADSLKNGVSTNLALMDQAHIVTTVPVQTTVQLQDNLPVEFDLTINEETQVSLVNETRIPGAYIYLNNTAVSTDLTLPAGTPLQFNLNTTIPVSQSVPVDITVPVSLLVPLDVAIDQTDLHQSIVGMQNTIEPYTAVLGEIFTSPEEIPLCTQWWSGWLCALVFGK